MFAPWTAGDDEDEAVAAVLLLSLLLHAAPTSTKPSTRAANQTGRLRVSKVVVSFESFTSRGKLRIRS
jgi:hypothetical protein